MVTENHFKNAKHYFINNTKNAGKNNENKKNIACDKSIQEKSNNFDPHDYGNDHHPTIFWGPVLHLFKTIVGTGILALPYTFQTVGYVTGAVSTLLIGLLYIHVVHILLDVEYEISKKLKIPNLTYIGVVQHSFEKAGPKFVHKFTFIAKIFVYFQYVVNGSLGNAVYLIMIASNFKTIIDYYFSVNSNMLFVLSVIIIPLIILGLIPNLKFLVPMSMLTNLFNFINIILILTISPHYNKIDSVKAINDLSQFPNFFGIVLGALTGTGMMLPLKCDMQNPKRFSSLFGVLNITVIAAAIAYALFGFLGYLKFGDEIQPNIISNLPVDNYLTSLVLVLYSIAICVSYTLFVYIAFDTVWTNLFKGSETKHQTSMEYAIRFGLNILPYFIAIAIPNFQIIVSVGGVIGILIDIAIPPFLHILMLTTTKKTTWVYMIIFKDFIIVAIALSLFIGGVFNVIDILSDFLYS